MKVIFIILCACILLSCNSQDGGWAVRYNHYYMHNRIIQDSIYLNPGDIYVYVRDWGNPFGGIEYSEFKVVEVKDGWVQYKYRPSWTPMKMVWSTGEMESYRFTMQIYDDYKGKYLTMDDIK